MECKHETLYDLLQILIFPAVSNMVVSRDQLVASELKSVTSENTKIEENIKEKRVDSFLLC